MKRYIPFLLILFLAACAPNENDTPDESLIMANRMVVYECNERLFSKTDAFQKIDAYLPTLQEMGVNVLWLMPIQPRGQKNAVGSPYCIKNYTAVEPAFGTIDDLKSLVADAHSREMLVILDWVANHSSWDNPWVTEHPDWYTEAQTSDERNWNDVTFIDYNNAEARQAMKDAMLFWIKEADVDGFRCDYAEGVPVEFWSDVNAAIKAIKPNAVLLAEASNTAYYDAGFDLLYSWNYLHAIEAFYQGKRTFSSFLSVSNSEFRSMPAGKQRLRYVTTHDETAEKSPSSCYTNVDGELSAFALTCFIGGVPMIYSSQEVGNTGTISFFDYKILSFTSNPKVTNAYKALMKAYQESVYLRSGEQTVGALTDEIACVEYRQGAKTLLFLCNTTNGDASFQYPSSYAEKQVTNLLTGQKERLSSASTTVVLAPYEYRIYKK